MKASPSRLQSQRGSLLIVSMIMSAVIGISIASYIRLGQVSQTISNRALYNNGAMNIAENGMEEAMYAVNQMVADPTYAWPDWTVTGDTSEDAQRIWKGYTFDQNATGVVRVYVQYYQGVKAPNVLTRATVTLGGYTSAPIEKWIEVKLAKTSKFANGLVAKRTINFSGNTASVDSWNSDPDNNDATAPVDYDASDPLVRNDSGSVGSISVTSSVSVANADIWGYVATGGTPATIGPNGLIGPFGTTAGTIADGHSSTDFSASFDPVDPPTAVYVPILAISSTTELPGVVPKAADGKYYIEVSSITLAASDTLKIASGADVVLKVTSTGTAIKTTGNAGIEIASGSSLVVYTDGDIAIGGNGILNGGTTAATANQPIDCQIWGTKETGTQNISIAGNGVLSAIVYAPQGAVTINGNGDILGSVVADTIAVTGNALFHYDESLANFDDGNPYRVAAWKELTTATARTDACALYKTNMDF